MPDGLPTGWHWTALEEIAADLPNPIVDGPFGSNLKVSDYVPEGVPVLQGKNITGDRFVWSDVRYISDEKAQELKRSAVRAGDILLVKIGTIGYSAIVDDLNGHDFAIIPANLLKLSVSEQKVCVQFVHHYLTSPEGKRRLIETASSTAQPALTLRAIRRYEVPVPPLPEQKKIAEILGSVDEAIQATQAVIDQTRKVKQGLLQQLLTRGIGHTRFKQTEIGEIPEAWDVVLLGEVCTRITDGSHQPVKTSDDGEIPFLYVSCIRNGEILWKNCARVSRAIYREISKGREPRLGAVLYTAVGSFGHAAVVQEPKEFTFQRHIAYLLPSVRIESRYIEIVPNLVEGGRAAVLKPGSLRESSKPFTTKENRREETISHSGFREATASQPQRPHPPAQPKLPTHAALG